MTDVLILVGKGSKQDKINSFAQQIHSLLQKQRLSVELVQYSVINSELSVKASQLVKKYQAKVLLSVGYTASFFLARNYKNRLVAAIPDIPGTALAPYDSALKNLEIIGRKADYLLVADEASRSLVEFHVPGVAGQVLIPENLTPIVSLTQHIKEVAITNVLISSHDFRFIADTVTMLKQIPGVSVRLQRWRLEKEEPEQADLDDLAWSDLILCEWAGRNLVWYSHHLPEGKRLIARLHGFEASSVWIEDVDFASLEKLVVVSEFFKQKVVDFMGWNPQKITVIGNTITAESLDRSKNDEACFHLGMLGFVPILKRPHVALEILSRLLEKDSRFVLHFRGKEPWTYSWIWNKNAQEVEAYRQFYSAIAQNSALRQHVVFEQSGANVESWLTKIGWILSISERETFHLAAAEGMASGAVPIFLPREGVDEIFSERWIHETPAQIADFIYEKVSSQTWSDESATAKEYAQRFDSPTAHTKWRQVLFE